MPSLRVYRVYISHAWDYNADYKRVVQFLDSAPNFAWEDVSVPEHEPIESDDTETLAYELRNCVRSADVLLVVSGMYVAHSDWIDFEMQFARRIGTPIIGILPWGAERVPTAVQSAAVTLVGWNTSSIVSAIREHALSEL